ncbi:Triglyceride lipase-cholesterol esterase [Handroanthus impetiginosus]|uniref:Triglyceride lipase-cholesterol esterase n=1 Tax=Handroanthus impetiginosus TaxID=429701 RepID=A0A2G9G322_9LAMI|nr:Triglyceride lipase-cholesterol esterase [Handroanthus impetiginosus]
MQRVVDNVLAVTKESVKTITYESLNNVVRLINGVSAMLLAILPGKASILEGIHGWELRPTFRGPRFPRWMENGVSSFNQFIHDLSVDSDTSSSVDYSSDGEDIDIYPGSPLSQISRFSRESSFTKRNRSWIYWIRCIISWILFPVKLLLGIPLYFFTSCLDSKAPSKSGNFYPSTVHSPRRLQTLKDNFFQRATDRRRGVVEDLHLAIEIFIESAFDVVHKAAHCLLAPADTIRRVIRWFSSQSHGHNNTPSDGRVTSVSTSVLSDNDPTPAKRKTSFNNSLNTDARTCQDVITELGYPYEAIRVVTSDGYVLLLERIPRRDSRKVVYLQHGILDSSMGWVSNGVVGSPAFAAFDQGYDVYLGNLRGLVSREHVNKNISSRQYWTYSINEHGTEDIPAMIEKIHEIKISELKSKESNSEEESNTDQPYKICAICHSLGGAAILMYVITRQIEEKPHRLSRMILLSPAGFHHDSSFMFTLVEYMFLFLSPVLAPFLPAFYIPTRFFRMLLNKLARDFHNLPAVGGLVQTLMSYVVGGDSSNWVGVLGLPHYNMNDMPGVAFRVALHLAQMKRSKKFMMFDYGSVGSNMAIYGSPEPLDLGEYYGFIDIPVDLVAGRKDKVIKPSMVRTHYKLMKDAGVDVSYSEFEYAHLDFTFSHREELLSYVMSRLLLVGPPSTKQPYKLKSLKLKRKDIQVGAGK